MKKIFISALLLSGILAYSQVGINTDTPHATLDIVASPTDLTRIDGLIAPRITKLRLNAKDALYSTDQTGAIVYVTGTPGTVPSMPKTVNVTTVGYYYFDGNIWVKLSTSESGVTPLLTANNGLTKTGDNIQLGGTLLQNTNIATAGNNMTFSGTGNIGVGTTSPTQKLDVAGSGHFTEKVIIGTAWLDGGALTLRNNVETNPIATFAGSDGILRTILTDGGNLGVGMSDPTEKLDVGGNVRFRTVPNETVIADTDRFMLLKDDGTGKKVPMSALTSGLNVTANNGLTKTGDNIQLGGVLTKDTNIGTGTEGYNITFGGYGNMGIGNQSPTEKLDVSGTIRLRAIPNGTTDDKVLVVDNNGVIKKSSLPPTSSFVLYDTNTNIVTRNADNVSRPLAFEGTPNKIYTDYIEKVNNTTYRAKKNGVYSVQTYVKYRNIPELSGNDRSGCRATLKTGEFIKSSLIGDRWVDATGTTSISRGVILNEGDEISVETGCSRTGNVTYQTDSGSTIFITYLPL